MGFHVVRNAGICCRRRKGVPDTGVKHFLVESRLRYGWVISYTTNHTAVITELFLNPRKIPRHFTTVILKITSNIPIWFLYNLTSQGRWKMTAKVIQVNKKCRCNPIFVKHNYDVKEIIHYGSCKNEDCNCNKFLPTHDSQNEAPEGSA